MQKDALKILLVTVVTGVFGMFLRWLQWLNAFEPDTGLAIPGAATSWILLVYLLLAVAMIAALTNYLLRQFELSAEANKALKSKSKLPELLCRALAVVLAAIGVALMFSAHEAAHPLLTRLLAASAMVCAASFFFLFDKWKGKKGEGNPFALVPVLFCCVWLICAYRDHAEDPVLWAFVVEILAIAANTMGCYELAAYSYGRAKPARALFFAQLAAFMSITALGDERSTAGQALFVGFACLMLLVEYLLLAGMRNRSDN